MPIVYTEKQEIVVFSPIIAEVASSRLFRKKARGILKFFFCPILSLHPKANLVNRLMAGRGGTKQSLDLGLKSAATWWEPTRSPGWKSRSSECHHWPASTLKSLQVGVQSTPGKGGERNKLQKTSISRSPIFFLSPTSHPTCPQWKRIQSKWSFLNKVEKRRGTP